MSDDPRAVRQAAELGDSTLISVGFAGVETPGEHVTHRLGAGTKDPQLGVDGAIAVAVAEAGTLSTLLVPEELELLHDNAASALAVVDDVVEVQELDPLEEVPGVLHQKNNY